jgi:hypothetical protein
MLFAAHNFWLLWLYPVNEGATPLYFLSALRISLAVPRPLLWFHCSRAFSKARLGSSPAEVAANAVRATQDPVAVISKKLSLFHLFWLGGVTLWLCEFSFLPCRENAEFKQQMWWHCVFNIG